MPQHPFAPVNPKQPGTALLWGRICLKTVPNSRQVRFPYGLHCSTTQEIWSTWSTQVCSMSTSQVHKSAALSIDDILLCKLQFAIVSVAVGRAITNASTRKTRARWVVDRKSKFRLLPKMSTDLTTSLRWRSINPPRFIFYHARSTDSKTKHRGCVNRLSKLKHACEPRVANRNKRGRKCPRLVPIPLWNITSWFAIALAHRRPKLITWTRTWLLLASGVVLQTVIYKGLYGIDRFFLKEIKNVMFLNKIDVPYCLVVFFVVCPRLRPFWSVFGELALFRCPSGTTKKKNTRLFVPFRLIIHKHLAS